MTDTIKTVIANQDSPTNKITKGKQYKVIGNDYQKYYQIIDDEGLPRWVWMERFDSPPLSSAKAIAEDAGKLAERLRVRDEVAEAIRCETKPGGMIYEHCKGRVTMGVDDFFIARAGVAHIGGAVMKSGIHSDDPNTQVLEQLRKVMRVPDGENIVTHAKVLRALADALIGLQK